MKRFRCAHVARRIPIRLLAVIVAALTLLIACGSPPHPPTTSTSCYRGEAPQIVGYPLQATPPAVGDGVVFIGVTGYEIAALRASDGMLLWRRPDPVGVEGLAVDHGLLFLSSLTHLAAMRATDGTVLWHAFRGSEGYGYSVLPVIDQGVLYAADIEGLYALRASDGQILWHIPPLAAQVPTGISGYSPYSQPVVSEGVVYVGSLNGPVAAVRSSDGTILWQTFVAPPSPRTSGPSQPLPQQPYPLAVSAGRLYAAAERGLLLLRTSDGKVAGSVPRLSQEGFDAGVVAGGILYTTGRSGTTYALRTSDGTLLWQTPIYAEPGISPAFDHGLIYVRMIGSFLLAVRASDGSVLWRYQGPGSFATGSGSVYLGQGGEIDLCYPTQSRPARLTALHGADGSVLWEQSLEMPH